VIFSERHAGRWGTCRRRHGNCGAGGIQTRHVSCMLSDGLVVDELLCAAELRPPSSRPCFVVCDHHRRTYSWVVGDWTSCTATSPHNTCNVGNGQSQVSVAALSSVFQFNHDMIVRSIVCSHCVMYFVAVFAIHFLTHVTRCLRKRILGYIIGLQLLY